MVKFEGKEGIQKKKTKKNKQRHSFTPCKKKSLKGDPLMAGKLFFNKEKKWTFHSLFILVNTVSVSVLFEHITHIKKFLKKFD